MATKTPPYPARLDIDYPKKLDRLTTFFRVILAIPILVVATFLTGSGMESTMGDGGKEERMRTRVAATSKIRPWSGWSLMSG